MRVHVATRKGLFTVERGSAGWRVARVGFVGDNVSLVGIDERDGAVYAALDLGHFGAKLYRSDDGGETFADIAAPAYPEKPAGLEDKDGSGREVVWSTQRIWAFAAGHASRPGELWCGTIPGGLFRSPDRGASWALVRSLWDLPERRQWAGGGADFAGVHSILVDPRNASRVLAGVSVGGAWLTEDGGETWQVRSKGMRAAYMPPEQAFDPVIQDPHSIVQCVAQPDVMWCQHHNGVFRSTDGGASWHEIDVPPSVFGFAVAVHPRDPDVAWLIPAVKDERRIPVGGQVVVSRTRDGGKTFEVLRRGLPQDHAYDLVYRHSFDIDASGDRLAFGSTTGSLWVSEDQGDTWDCVSSHLPPIYAVRFGRVSG